MRLRRFIQALHRWLGLILAAQIVIWMTSGVVMSLLPIEHVRGETATSIAAPIELNVENYFPPAGVIAEVDGAQKLTLRKWFGRAVYIVEGASGVRMFDADTGEMLSPIGETDARRVAEADFAGEGEIENISILTEAPQEYRRKTPVWRAQFSDKDQTRLYISTETGEVVARRNRVWRFYDFFWMLHIMDYRERENFNNPLIRTFALTGLLFALSGLSLVIFRLRSGRYLEDARKRGLTASNGGATPESKNPPSD